jgi:hypothetical protein
MISIVSIRKINVAQKYKFCATYINFEQLFYNRFAKLIHVPKEGRWDNVNKVLHHIFDYPNNDGEVLYEMALDYFQLLFTNPKQRLPILCLVSWEQKTGKSTLLHFLSSIFQENAVCMDTVRLNNKFRRSRLKNGNMKTQIFDFVRGFVDIVDVTIIQ